MTEKRLEIRGSALSAIDFFTQSYSQVTIRWIVFNYS